MIKMTINANQHSQRLDRFLRKEFPSASMSMLFKIIRKKKIRVNGKRGKAEQMLSLGDEVCIYENLPANSKPDVISLQHEKYISVVYEDDNLLVLNKPFGIPVHSGSDGLTSLIEYVWSYLSWNESGAFKPSLVHRLDKGTSGIILVCKNAESLRQWTSLMRHRKLSKKYYALTHGVPESQAGVIELKLARTDSSKGSKVLVSEQGIYSRTEYKVLSVANDTSLIELTLGTGRMHQIRTHMAHIGCPIVGDDRYGDYAINKEYKKKYGIHRMCLHSHLLEFENWKFQADLPDLFLKPGHAIIDPSS